MKLPGGLLLLPFGLSLAACGSGPVAKGANNTAGLNMAINKANATAAAATRRGAVVQETSRNSAVPIPAKTDGAEPTSVSDAIPSVLSGRWGLTPGDCTSTRGDAKGLLIVSPDGLRFYEAVARPAGNIRSSESSFSADFDFSGEGQSWKKFETLRLQGDKLVRTEGNPMASYTYVRCS